MESPTKLFSMNFVRLRNLLAATALMLLTLPLHATLINPGDTINPLGAAFPNPGNPPIIEQLSGTFNFGSGALKGTYDEIVLLDPLGLTCTSCLDFVFFFNVDPTSTASISTFGFASLAGYTTNIGYVTGGGSGGINPDFATRFPSSGAVVGWGFTGLVGPGQSTNFLVVATNATKFDKSGFVSWNEDPTSVSQGRASGFVFSLDGPVAPEPSTVVLLSLGLVGIAAFRKRAS